MFSCVRSLRSFICTILRSKVDARYHVTLEITRMESDIVNRNAAFVLSDSCGVNSIANRLIRELEKPSVSVPAMSKNSWRTGHVQ